MDAHTVILLLLFAILFEMAYMFVYGMNCNCHRKSESFGFGEIMSGGCMSGCVNFCRGNKQCLNQCLDECYIPAEIPSNTPGILETEDVPYNWVH
jgi:hypothetical protein